uniref:unspecific monooxygenase n=1 Tax=Takifugu rubripes TaxID=31033 RepID=A0A674MJK5_TAKRU
MKSFVDLNTRFTTFVQKIVNEHYATFDKENIRDMTDSLIDHCEGQEKIVGIVNDLFGAGSLRRLYQELKSNVIRNRKPRLSDKPNLPLLEAFILELFRHSSFPHFQRHVSNGYFIPKDTCVFINQWQINHDPEQWEDPSSFNPDRFLSADGTEVNKAEGEKVTTFGMGKRRCIGEIIARNEVYLFLTVDMTPEYGLTMKHKDCRLKARMRTRDEQ